MKSTVRLGDSRIGKGLFATRLLRRGEPLFFVTGKVLSFSEVMEMPAGADRTIQIGLDSYVVPGWPAEFVNHSCEPNAGIRDDLSIVAIRNIQAGEEVCFDYSTCILERSWTMDCACGASRCRGVIGDFDGLSRELQMSYVDMGIVQPFIMEAVFKRRPHGRSLAYSLPVAGRNRLQVLFQHEPAVARNGRALASIA